jgi:formamidopyrimidine-DNA glycosylase
MPELPEVETVRRGLHELIIGRNVQAARSDTPKSFPNAPTQVASFMYGATVTDVRRRAKVLMIDLSTKYTLVVHLKMTGQLVFVSSNNRSNDEVYVSSEHTLQGAGGSPVAFGSAVGATVSSDTHTSSLAGDRVTPRGIADDIRFGAGHPNDSLVGQLPDRSTRVTITFTDGSQLFFNDQRKFGWMRLMPTDEVMNLPFMMRVGPEPLLDDFTAKQFAARFVRRAKTSIKAALLDQTVVAGVGNIYADESLWGAKIHPKRLVGSITTAEFELLYTELRDVMNLAIEKGGSTNKNYVNAEGKRGSYMDFARVFRREGLECPRCGTTIIKFKAAGRGTHICPLCQIE